MSRTRSRYLCLILLLTLFASGASPTLAQGGGDQVIFRVEDIVSVANDIRYATLPRGPVLQGPTLSDPPIGFTFDLEHMTFSPEGDLVLLQLQFPPIPSPLGFGLYTIEDDGTLEIFGTGNAITLDDTEFPKDLGYSPDGRLFVLVDWSPPADPPSFASRLLEVDPRTSTVVNRFTFYEPFSFMSRSPKGFWLFQGERILHYNTTTQVLDDPGLTFPGGVLRDVDTDSTGALWALDSGIIAPPIYRLVRFDPVTSALRESPIYFHDGAPYLAIERGCASSDTVRCLQGGRFAAKIRWRDYDNREGDGQVAPSASADSALFWFFDASNWEVLVKIIDGCERNGHYWVYTAGTTDVEYTLEVTDLKTGQVFTSTNTLGQAAPAVTENRAFSTCP